MKTSKKFRVGLFRKASYFELFSVFFSSQSKLSCFKSFWWIDISFYNFDILFIAFHCGQFFNPLTKSFSNGQKLKQHLISNVLVCVMASQRLKDGMLLRGLEFAKQAFNPFFPTNNNLERERERQTGKQWLFFWGHNRHFSPSWLWKGAKTNRQAMTLKSTQKKVRK